MKKYFLSILALVSCTLLLSACGQKGPLYMPEKEIAPVLQKEQPTHSDTKKTKTTQSTTPVENNNEVTQ